MGPRMHTIMFVAIEFMETHIVDHRQIICRTTYDSGKKRPIDQNLDFKPYISTVPAPLDITNGSKCAHSLLDQFETTGEHI